MLHSIINSLSFVITVALYVIFCTGQYCYMRQLSFYLSYKIFVGELMFYSRFLNCEAG